MALFQVTVIKQKYSMGIRLEPGMSVQVVSETCGNPLFYNGGKDVIDAFKRIYGIDLKQINALSSAYLEVSRMN